MFRAALVAATLLISSCDPDISTFNKESRALFERHTYSDDEWSEGDFGELPTPEQIALAERFAPSLLLAPDGLAPVDFYRDYLPNSSLKTTAGKVLVPSPSRKELKACERTLGVHLDLDDDVVWPRAENLSKSSIPLYYSVHEEELVAPAALGMAGQEIPVVVVGYRLAFPYSGLPTVLKGLTPQLAGLIGDPNEWHELDIHGAIFVIVEKRGEFPIAVVLAQHNHFRSFVLGKDLPWITADEPLCVSYSLRSNEPYVCPDPGIAQPMQQPTSGDPKDLRYLFQRSNEPPHGPYDLVFGEDAGAIPLETTLECLPSRDPLLASWIPLGEPRKILGVFDSISRTGPPGMLINTWPGNPSVTELAQIFYFLPENELGIKASEEALPRGVTAWQSVVKDINGRHFWARLLWQLSERAKRSKPT